MVTSVTDRVFGVLGSLGLKAPCRVATTASVAHSGLITVDGVALADGDRVLDKDNADAALRGVWVARSTAWERAADFDGANDVVTGTMVYVYAGTANQKTYWRVDTTGTILPGTTSLAFSAGFGTLDVEADIHAAAAKATLVDADEIGVIDSAASWGLKKATLANLWTWAKTKIAADSGGQIKFPAAQNPSADANTLDDYEEGTWTPSIGGTATYTTQQGFYTKIGNLVCQSFNLRINVLGTGSTTTITGMPFTPAHPSNGAANYTTSATNITTLVSNHNGSSIFLVSATAAAASLNQNAIFQANAIVSATNTYTTA